MRLEQLCSGLAGVELPRAAAQLDVNAVRGDSRQVQPGDLFVAVPGEEQDGAEFVKEAVTKGAIGIVAETALDAPVPVVVVPDARLALATLTAEALGRPADSLVLAGITGTLGKTSVLSMVEAILKADGVPVGTVGSLGIHWDGHDDTTPNTTPGAGELQEAMAGMVEAGTRVMAMEVTSHALMQGRVHGLMYDVGVFTNLAMLEHMEYHGTFAGYVDAKLRFFQHLKPQAPLVFSAGDRAVSAAARRHGGPRISVGGGNSIVTVRRSAMSLDGTKITLNVRRPLCRVGDAPLEPTAFTIQLATLGRTNAANASIAAAAALVLGATAESVQSALAQMRPPPRRLQVLQHHGPVVIDDTVGHPDSITGVFEVAQRVPHRRLHVVFCIRGQRGGVINQRDAEALAIWSRQVPIHSFVTTSGDDSADERNRVEAEERDAFLSVIQAAGLRHRHHERLADAVEAMLDEVHEDDLVLLLGAQGMDAGAELLRQGLETRGLANPMTERP
ncbi:MAG TPA: Mur ligase family protein [Longimicrobiales bacterium]|nr:Mur ligase family protein [Longimicrobiales bacterium]